MTLVCNNMQCGPMEDIIVTYANKTPFINTLTDRSADRAAQFKIILYSSRCTKRSRFQCRRLISRTRRLYGPLRGILNAGPHDLSLIDDGQLFSTDFAGQ